MIDIRHLINFLPFYFKDKDTYKVEGKGILERFLEICGDYFTDNLKSKIDNHLDIIHIDTTSNQYLVWLWDLLGQIPFANKPSSEPLMLSDEQQRDLIRYCNGLLKIRGSKEFFEIMFRIYSNPTNQLKLVSIECEDFGWNQDSIDSRVFIEKRSGTSEVKGYQNDKSVLWPYHDRDIMDDPIIRFDEYYSMKQCIEVKFDISGNFSNPESANKAIEAFISRYIPYNVKPIIIINGVKLSEKYTLVLEIYQNGRWTIPQGDILLTTNQVLKARVCTVNSRGELIEGIKFISSLNGGDTMYRTSTYIFVVSNVLQDTDVYNFTLGEESISLKISLKVEKDISYYISANPKNINLSATVKEVECTVTAYSQQDSKRRGVLVLCKETGEVKDPLDGFTTKWLFNKSGKYTFVIIGHTSSQSSVVINSWRRSYLVKLAKANLVGNKWVPGVFVKELTLTGTSVHNLKYYVKVESDDPEVPVEYLTCYIEGMPSKIYPSNQLLTPSGFDSYIFTPYHDGPNNESAILSVVSSNLSFTTSIVSRYNIGTGSSIDEINESVSQVAAIVRTVPKNTSSQILASKGLSFIVELPNGNIIKIDKGATKTGPGYEIISKPGTSYLGNPSYNELELKVTQSGEYLIWPESYPSSKVKWIVTENIITEDKPDGIIIIPVSDEDSWTGGNSANATFQLGEVAKEAKFKLSAFRMVSGSISLMGVEMTVEGSNGLYYELDTEYSETQVQDIVFTATYNKGFSDGSTTKQANLHIRDFVTEVVLKCTPSTALLINDQAQTKLSISSNKSELKLSILYKGTSSDEYHDGDTFTVNNIGKYVFTALVDGKPFKDDSGKEITSTFTVSDKNALEVEPLTLEFNSDGTPVTTDVFDIITGDDTEWTLIQQ